VFEQTEGLVGTEDRSAILRGGNNQINARDLNCFRGIWSSSYTGDVRKRIEQGLEQATIKRRCQVFSRGVMAIRQKPIVNYIENERPDFTTLLAS